MGGEGDGGRGGGLTGDTEGGGGVAVRGGQEGGYVPRKAGRQPGRKGKGRKPGPCQL